MTFADWLDHTRARFAADPAPAAARASLQEFVRGARRRLEWALLQELGQETVATRPAGVRCWFHVRNTTDLERALTLNREEPVAEWLFADVPDDAVFWDVGAYHGHFSVLAAAHGCRVVAFEPDPDNRYRIRENVAANSGAGFSSGVQIESAALSDQNAEGVGFGGDEANKHAVGGDAFRVETRRGDDIDPAPHLVKIDVEGHECAVLDGMKARLGVVDRIAIEVHEERGVDVHAVADRLRGAGLTAVPIETPRSQTYIGGVRR